MRNVFRVKGGVITLKLEQFKWHQRSAIVKNQVER